MKNAKIASPANDLARIVIDPEKINGRFEFDHTLNRDVFVFNAPMISLPFREISDLLKNAGVTKPEHFVDEMLADIQRDSIARYLSDAMEF